MVDLKKTGVYVYAADPTTDIWWLVYAFDDGPLQSWRPGQPIAKDLADHICAGGIMAAHNASFERAIWHAIMTPRYGWPEPAVEQWRCTMVMAYAMALPGALEHVGPALNTGFEKDMAGNRLMKAMMRPRKPKKGEVVAGLVWRDGPEDVDRLGKYCGADVEAERAADKRLVRLRKSELDLWHLDQKINDRGVPVDAELCNKALAIVERHMKNLDGQMAKITDWEVTACSNVNQLKVWLKRQGVQLGEKLNTKTMLYAETLGKEIIAEILARQDISPAARRALQLRQEGGKASVDKIDALLNGMSADGRARGLLQFHAANTGRWGGRRFQPQNILRPDESFDVGGAIDVILKYDTTRAMEILDTLFGAPITCISYILRGMIKAEPGKKIVAADLANIEGRMLAWLAGETSKLKAFANYDRGEGHDLYKIMAGGILGKDPKDVTKEERQAYGKVSELACGYGGGVGAFQTMAHTYGVKMTDEQADEIKRGWRDENPRITQFWSDADDAAIRAVLTPGKVADAGKVRFKSNGSFLWAQLPSGRALCYPYPKVMDLPTPWGQVKPTLTFKTVPNVSNTRKIVHADQSNTSKWARIQTYGGAIVENLTQAAARDILADGMVRLEANGYPLILTVHDESVSEVPENYGSAEEYEQIMSELPPWAAGLPVAASGFEDSRYRK